MSECRQCGAPLPDLPGRKGTLCINCMPSKNRARYEAALKKNLPDVAAQLASQKRQAEAENMKHWAPLLLAAHMSMSDQTDDEAAERAAGRAGLTELFEDEAFKAQCIARARTEWKGLVEGRVESVARVSQASLNITLAELARRASEAPPSTLGAMAKHVADVSLKLMGSPHRVHTQIQVIVPGLDDEG